MVNRKRAPYRQFVLYGLAVLLMANLNALVDAVLHPQIPYFDEEHLVVGGVTGVMTACLLFLVVLYTRKLKRQIAARKKAEKSLQRINAELELRVKERTRALETTHRQLVYAEKLSAVGKLSASISHEFNNPLQGVMNIIRSIHDGSGISNEEAKLLEMALRECHRMKDLIVQLQIFHRPPNDRISQVDLHGLIDGILIMVGEDFREKKISLEKRYADNLPQILAVGDLLKQVVLNLLSNAADACEAGGTVTISTERRGHEVAIQVKDTGKGIPKKDLPHIFEPFFSTKPQVKGVGLGLSVSYGIIKNHSGTITVRSEEGKGSVFTVILPVTGLSSRKAFTYVHESPEEE